MRKKDADEILKEDEDNLKSPPSHPTPPPLTEEERMRTDISDMEARIKVKVDSGTCSPQEQLSDRQVIEQKHFQLRKTLFKTQVGDFKLFENALSVIKQKKLPPDFDMTKLTAISQLADKVMKAAELIAPELEAVSEAKTNIEGLKAKNLKIDVDIQAMVNDLKSQKVLNSDAMAREEREIKRLLGGISETQPIWVAFEYPAIFNEVCGEPILSSAAISTTPTTSANVQSDNKTVGSKPSDLTQEEHKAMLDALRGETGKAAVQQAIAEGAKSTGNKEIFDKISQKVLGKTFAHIGSLDTSIYNIRGLLNLR